jgi:hypothetical protein
VRRKRIALQYATLKQDTSRYREEMQTKFKYPAETTTNAAKIPRQMSLFIKQDQIITNPKEDYRNNYNKRKVAPSYTQKMTPKQNQKRIRAKLQYFPTQVKEMHVREMIIPAQPAAAQRHFPFL